MNRRYCSIKEMSEYTSLPVKTLYEWASIGKIPSIKIGRRVLFDLLDVDDTFAGLKNTSDKAEETSNKIVREIEGNDL